MAALPHEKAPRSAASASIDELPAHPVSEATTPPPGLVLFRVSFGSGRRPVRPKIPSAGPDPRTSTDCVPETPPPPTTKPAVMMFVPVPTCARQERFVRRPGFEVPTMDSTAGSLVTVPVELVAVHV